MAFSRKIFLARNSALMIKGEESPPIAIRRRGNNNIAQMQALFMPANKDTSLSFSKLYKQVNN